MQTLLTIGFALLTNEARWLNARTLWLLGVVLALVIIAYCVGLMLGRQPESNINPALLRTFNLRVRAWLLMYAILSVAFSFGFTFTIVLFGLVSFWALREFITMTPTRRADHRALFWVLVVFTPLQYLLVGIGRAFVDPAEGTWADWWAELLGLRGMDFYGLYSIMIPVYGSLFIPARIALSGDYKHFLERTAKIQAGLLICVYSLSHAPALLQLELATRKPEPESSVPESSVPESSVPESSVPESSVPESSVREKTDSEVRVQEGVPPATLPEAASRATRPADAEKMPPRGEPVEPTSERNELASNRPSLQQGIRPWREGSRAGLLFYFVLIVQTGDVFQYIWGKALGRRVIAPEIHGSRTWEGLLGGVVTTTLLGTVLWWVTPFKIWEAALMSLVTAVMGFAGGMTMSAIKRDRGVTDTGMLVQGHAGVLDRIDSICFSAPVFFHLTRLFFSILP